MAKCLVGFTVLIASNCLASDFHEPRYYNATGRTESVRFLQQTFGYFNTLDKEQKRKYYGSIQFAVERLNPNDPPVSWYENNASGSVSVLYAENITAGFCKKLLIDTIAYGVQKQLLVKGCFNEADNNWSWYQ